MLSTQIRSYVLLLLCGLLFIITDHRLISTPKNYYILFLNFALATALIFTHNFGAFYVAVSFSFFCVLFIWSRKTYYLYPLVSHILSVCVWLLLWFPNFQIQSQTGKPHTWIPPLTFLSFFRTISELIPTLSSQLERSIQILPVIKVLSVVVIFFYISIPKLRIGFKKFVEDKAFSFYILSGYISFMVAGLSMIISLVYMSVFLSRYQWISHLLIIYQIIYAYNVWAYKIKYPRFVQKLAPVYIVFVAAFMFYQNKKISIFPSGILSYLPQLNKEYPVFFESADYFFPIWHHKNVDAYYLLNWEAALAKDNMLNATVDHKMALSLREEYNVNKIVYVNELTQKRFSHFYVVDEVSRKQFEPLIKEKKVKIVKIIPVGIEGHRILECTI
ncbi:hypothetical protein [Spirosoma sp. KUDC1026]|uniref:hypothetical protein n=1 Tax=Spirosoma sp. KUDC1026 TaxID=2745947 RepID=UPI00159BB975|nr:hypothetical protein [Spirosoma sp. KUDC1026]QKZ11380.1 hypothetical protein HU175_01500 [Spirosoma sp. KUDC1026]